MQRRILRAQRQWTPQQTITLPPTPAQNSGFGQPSAPAPLPLHNIGQVFHPFSGHGHVLGGDQSTTERQDTMSDDEAKDTKYAMEEDEETASEEDYLFGSGVTSGESKAKPQKRKLALEDEESETDYGPDPLENLSFTHLLSPEADEETTSTHASPKRQKQEVSDDEGSISAPEGDVTEQAHHNFWIGTGIYAMPGALSPTQIQHWAKQKPTKEQVLAHIQRGIRTGDISPELVHNLFTRPQRIGGWTIHSLDTMGPKSSLGNQALPSVLHTGSTGPKALPTLKLKPIKLKPPVDYSDDEEEETSKVATKEHYVGKILNDLEGGKRYNDHSSSDSDDAIDADHPKESRAKRRALKLTWLKALAHQTRPLTPEELAKQQKFQKAREQSYANRPEKRRKYESDAQDQYQDLAEEFEQTSFLHNPLLRRSFRGAVSKQKIEEGGSANYNQSQGKVRDELRKQIAKEMAEFSESDFSDPEDYATLKHMGKYRPSNDKTKTRLHEAIQQGNADDPNASTVTEYHHVGFKEFDSRIGKHALNPANLTMLFGERTEKSGKRVHGGHQKAHDLQGFQPPDKQGKTWHGRGGGGVFKNMDVEGTHYITRHLGKKRVPKSKLYQIDPSELSEGSSTEAESPLLAPVDVPQNSADDALAPESEQQDPTLGAVVPQAPTPPREQLRQLAAQAAEERLKRQKNE